MKRNGFVECGDTKQPKIKVMNMDVDITTEEFLEKRSEEKGVVIDVRTRDEHADGHLPETDLHADFLNGDFHDQLAGLDENQTYYLYCRSGNRSGKAARMMRDHGFEKAYNIGGYEGLASATGREKK